MAQQFMGGGIVYDRGAALRDSAKGITQVGQMVGNNIQQRKAQFLAEYQAREKSFVDNLNASGLEFDKYVLGQGKDEYLQLLAARNNLGRIFAQGKQAQQAFAEAEMNQINQNISPAAMGYGIIREAKARGLAPGGRIAVQTNAPQTGPQQPVVQQPVAQQPAVETPPPEQAQPEVTSESRANPAILNKYLRFDNTAPAAGVGGFTVVDPKTGFLLTNDNNPPNKDGSNVMRFTDAARASQALATMAKNALEGEAGRLSLEQEYKLQQIVPGYPTHKDAKPKPTPAERNHFAGWKAAQPKSVNEGDTQRAAIEASRVRGGIYANAPQTAPAQSQATPPTKAAPTTMAEKQAAAKETKAAEAAPALDAAVSSVTSGTKVDTKTAMKGFAAAKKVGNYFDNLKEIPDNELQAMVAKWEEDVNTMTPEELELAGMTAVANRRATSQQLEAAANLELMKAKIAAAAQQGKAAPQLAEQAVKAIEALQKMESDIPELMKAQGLKMRADFFAKNPDYEANLKMARRYASELTGLKLPEFDAIPSGFFWFQKGKFVPTQDLSGFGAEGGGSADLWAALQQE